MRHATSSTVPTTEQVEAIFAELIRSGDRDTYHAGLLAADLGLRLLEIAHLQWNAVDFDKGIITVLQSSTSLRVARMTDRVRRELGEQRRAGGNNAYVVLPGDDRSAAVRKLRSRLSKVASHRGIDIQFHSLRRKCAMDLLTTGLSICDVTTLLGHSCPRTADCFFTSYRRTA